MGKKKKKEKSKKAWSQNVDLEILPAIFVSTGMNRNDDVFLPEETWAARNTIINKPVNLSHDNEEIVGHIFEAYIVDQETGERYAIAEEVEEEDEIENMLKVVQGSKLENFLSGRHPVVEPTLLSLA